VTVVKLRHAVFVCLFVAVCRYRLVVIDDNPSETKCMRFYFTMNGFHTGILRVYRVISDVLRDFLWMMSGDQLPGWKIAAVDINMTSVTEVEYTSPEVS